MSQRNGVLELMLVAYFLFIATDIDIVFVVVPGRDAVTPPDLAADAPVLDVVHPFEVAVLFVVGNEADASTFDGIDGRFGQRPGLDIPLVGQERFDDDTGAVAARNLEIMVFDLLQQALGFQVGNDTLARLETVEADIGRGDQAILVDIVVADRGIDGEDVDQTAVGLFEDRAFFPVPLPDLVIVEVVGRGDLDAAGAEFRVHMLVDDDRDVPPGQGQFDGLADQVGIAFVAGCHGHGAIAEQGFRAGGGDHQVALLGRQGVADVPHRPLFIAGNDFQVGNRGVELRVPVDQPLAAVDQALLVELDEGFPDRFGQPLVHGETLVFPVQGGAQATQLSGDGAAGFLLPFPDALDELLASEVVTGQAFGLELAFHHHLGGDAGMIGARLPQGTVALHAVVADQRIHDRIVETVTHVQTAGDIRRRDHDAVGLVAVAPGSEIAVFLPALVPGLFDRMRVVGLLHGSRVGWA